MGSSGETIDWAALERQKFIFEDGCWTTCGGGFCCSNSHPDFNFKLIPMQGTTLLYLEAEYEFMAANRRVPQVHHHKKNPNVLSFEFGAGRPIMVVHTPCHLLGRCDGVIDKPLLCRLYPFIPVMTPDGELEELVHGSIFDLTFEVIGAASPCTVSLRRQKYFEFWRDNSEQTEPLRHPYIMFYLKAAQIFAQNYADQLRRNDKLMALSGKEFWTAWEWAYLSGKLFDTAKLRTELKASLDALSERHGNFW